MGKNKNKYKYKKMNNTSIKKVLKNNFSNSQRKRKFYNKNSRIY